MRRIKKETINNYVSYFNELKRLSENYSKNHIKFSVSELQTVHGVNGDANSAAKSLGFLKIKGHGRNVSYDFIVKNFEPFHARKVIERIRKKARIASEKRKMNKTHINKRVHSTVDDTVKKKVDIKLNYEKDSLQRYIDFFKTLKVLVDNDAKFYVGDLLKKHNVSKNTMTFAYSTGLLKKDANNNYKFNKEINEYNVLSIIKTISHYQNQHNRTKGKFSEKTKPEVKKYKGMETDYYLFGIKIMTSKTKFI